MSSTSTCGGLKVVVVMRKNDRRRWELTVMLDQLRLRYVCCDDIYQAAGEVVSHEPSKTAVVGVWDHCGDKNLQFFDFCNGKGVKQLVLLHNASSILGLETLRSLLDRDVQLSNSLITLKQNLLEFICCEQQEQFEHIKREDQAAMKKGLQQLNIDKATRQNLLSQDELDALLGMG